MMKRIATFVLVLVLGVAAAAAAQTGSITGTARNADNTAQAGVKVQLRNVDTGALVGSTQSAADGTFTFAGLPPGNFVVEIVDASGKIVGVSAAITVTPGASITGISVAATAAGMAAAVGGGFTSFFTSTAGILTGLALVGGIAAGVVVLNDASASR